MIPRRLKWHVYSVRYVVRLFKSHLLGQPLDKTHLILGKVLVSSQKKPVRMSQIAVHGPVPSMCKHSHIVFTLPSPDGRVDDDIVGRQSWNQTRLDLVQVSRDLPPIQQASDIASGSLTTYRYVPSGKTSST